jgi:hypothetical protein
MQQPVTLSLYSVMCYDWFSKAKGNSTRQIDIFELTGCLEILD